MKYVIVIIILSFSFLIYAQNESFINDFVWMVKTFEENDAGYQYAINIKGLDAYKKHNEIFKERVNRVKDIDEFYILLNNWTKFFRNGHIGIEKLAAKQSRKVKLYGKTTYGELNISNLYGVKFPSGNFKLWYGLSRTKRIPKFTIDDKGIQPDYYFDKLIPEYKWIKHILQMTE